MDDRKSPIFKRGENFFLLALSGWFYLETDWLSAWMKRIAIPIFYLIGLYQWADFLNWGKIPTDLADWADITFPRLVLLQDALMRGILPLNIQLATGMKGATDRYLAIPDIFLSPQGILLRYLQSGPFILLNTLLMFSLSFYGLLLLRRKFKFSLAAFMILFVLFNFNGHIVDHLSIGHFSWEGYFLLPFFALLTFNLLEGDTSWSWIAKFSLLMLVIFLQGSFHLFVWCLLFISVLSLFKGNIRKAGLLGCLSALLLCALRIAPAGLVATDLKIGFSSGFTSLGDLLKGLVELVVPAHALDANTLLNPQVNWWEFDHYIGWVGLTFIVVFGLYFWFKKSTCPHRYLELVLPIGLLTLISIGRIYKVVFLLNIPLLSGERVTSRFLILPLVFLIFLGTAHFQVWLNEHKPWPAVQSLFLALSLILFSDLTQHMELWKVVHLNTLFAPTPPDLAQWVVNNHADPVYTLTLVIGLGVSILTSGCLIVLSKSTKKL